MVEGLLQGLIFIGIILFTFFFVGFMISKIVKDIKRTVAEVREIKEQRAKEEKKDG